jgi:tRNA threonylcarbamoyladenosine biosynthesis protein TsaE
MRPRTVVTHSPEETIALGHELARELKTPVLVLLLGDLGAGKTTLAKGLVAGLGAALEEEVTSPTFTMIHEYGTARDNAARVYHVDLYRVETARELETLGLEDLLAERAVVIVEWGEKLGPALRPSGTGGIVEIHLEAVSENERRIEIRHGSRE